MGQEDLRLAEYKRFAELFWKNEEAGERRVSFYVTFITAVMGGLVAFWTADLDKNPLNATDRLWVTIAALAFACAFGIVTYLRMLQRDRVTDGYKEVIDRLRALLAESSGTPTYKLPFPAPRHYLLNGGLAQSVGLLNSVLLATIVFLALGSRRPLPWAMLTFVAAVVVHHLPISRRHRRKGARSDWFRHGVGAVIASETGEILAFERSDAPGAWQCPQGGVNAGEEPVDALLRELREEVGLLPSQILERSEMEPPLGYRLPPQHRTAKTGTGQVHDWFLIRLKDGKKWQPCLGEEFRDASWLTPEELLEKTAPFRRPVYRHLFRVMAGTE